MRVFLRAFFILYYVYPASLVLVIASVSMGLLAAMSASTAAGLLALLLASLSVVNSLRLSSEADYLRSQIPGRAAELVINLRGPFVAVSDRQADLGDRPGNVDFRFDVILHNIGQADALGVQVTLLVDDESTRVEPRQNGPFDLGPGEAAVLTVVVRPAKASNHKSRIAIEAAHEHRFVRKMLIIRTIFPGSEAKPVDARVSRWRHGYAAAVAWRADVDGFDNLSNEQNLLSSLEVSRLFRIPASIFISARLCLDFNEWRSWASNLPGKFDGPITSDRFSEWLRFLGRIKARDDLEYPMSAVEDLSAQIGSHMYYHYWSAYGYDASTDTEWEKNIAPGSVRHGWMSGTGAGTAYSEILDNIRINSARLEEFFGQKPRTWSAPADRPHEHYPRALEEAGLLGASEAVARTSRLSSSLAPYRPDLGESMPFHPGGSRIVETGAHVRRFDPHTLTQVICLKRAVRRAIRRRTQVTFVWHPHLRLYPPFFGPESSLRHFPEFIRFLVQDMGSTCWLTTHHNIATYWDSVLCADHRVVHVEVRGESVIATNASDKGIRGVPVDITYEGGRRCCQVVDLDPRSSVVVV